LDFPRNRWHKHSKAKRFSWFDAGYDPDNKEVWSIPVAYQELPEGHSAITSLHHFASINYDNCSTNTGPKNGLGKLLEEERKLTFEQNKEGSSCSKLVPFIKKGCSDHVMNLISQEFSKILLQVFKTMAVITAQYWGFFVMFYIHKWAKLTEKDKEDFRLLMDPLVQAGSTSVVFFLGELYTTHLSIC